MQAHLKNTNLSESTKENILTASAKTLNNLLLPFHETHCIIIRDLFYVSIRIIYEEAMDKGFVETSLMKCVIVGAPGVGKTHLIHLLLKRNPPELRISTGLAENAVRAISFSLLTAGKEDDWFSVDDDKSLLNIIGKTVKQNNLCTLSLANALSTDITSNNIDVEVHHQDLATNVGTAEVEKELIHDVNHPSGKND